jgi:hypothetical protein
MLPHFIDLIGYFVATAAIGATALVSTGKRNLARIGFMIWILTNSFELFVFSYYYNNVWASCQFSIYLCLAFVSVYNYRGK